MLRGLVADDALVSGGSPGLGAGESGQSAARRDEGTVFVLDSLLVQFCRRGKGATIEMTTSPERDCTERRKKGEEEDDDRVPAGERL